MSKILPSQGNVGYDPFLYGILKSMNGKQITRLQDLPEALKQPISGFHQFEFAYDPKHIYLDAKGLENENKMIMNRYNLSQLSHFNKKRN